MSEAPQQETIDLLHRQLQRERAARQQAEDIAEAGMLRLYERQQLSELLRTTAEASALAAGVTEALQVITHALGRYLQWPLGHAFLVIDTPAGKRLRHAQATWGAATPEQVAFDTALKAANFRCQEGLLGRVWNTGRTVWASDCAKSWPDDRLKASGLETALAFPVCIQDEVVAVVVFFHRAVLIPDEAIIETSKQIGHLLGRVFERDRAQAAQAATQQLLEAKVAERTAELETMARQLTEAARLKDEFLAAISHELRTPLTAILGFAEVMLANTHGPLNEKQTKAMTFIDEGGRHLLALINDLLDLSKINAGRESLAQAWTQPGDLCESIVHLMRPLAAEKKLHLELHLSDHLPPVWGEERRLRQVLLNLLGNAIKFTEPGGHVTVEAKVGPTPGRIQIAVADTGIGISAEFLPRLFTPFSQVDGRLARRFGGTGLGLALAHKLVLLHRGELMVTSQIGQGTTFTVSLPTAPPSELIQP